MVSLLDHGFTNIRSVDIKPLDQWYQVFDNIVDPINLGSNESVSIDQLVDIAEDIAGIKLDRHYKLDAPKGVNGRNSDNTLFQEYLGWQLSIRLRGGMEKTFAWIHGEYLADNKSPEPEFAAVGAKASTNGHAKKLATSRPR